MSFVLFSVFRFWVSQIFPNIASQIQFPPIFQIFKKCNFPILLVHWFPISVSYIPELHISLKWSHHIKSNLSHHITSSTVLMSKKSLCVKFSLLAYFKSHPPEPIKVLRFVKGHQQGSALHSHFTLFGHSFILS